MPAKAVDHAGNKRREPADVIRSLLLDEIIRGRLPPGTRLLERVVATRFTTSRTPTRQALQRLTHEGFLVTQGPDARRGELRVAPLHWGDIAELWQIIGSLEAIAARRVELLAVGEREQLAHELRRINAELRAAWTTHARDPDLAFDLQSSFHRVMVTTCGGRRLHVVYEAVRPHIERYEWLYGASDASHIVESLAEHEAMAAAIERGNGMAAALAVTTHWQLAAERSVQVLKTALGPSSLPALLRS
ncbi:MAG: GntR family transcriptional regulator [Gemmatimonadota bacterium]